MPARGTFTFPAPYGTRGVRLSNGTDCGGADCVNYVGYSYWRNINNHVGSSTMLIFLGLERSLGGGGPTLFSYDKTTELVTNLGPLFDPASPLSWASGEGWYFSATRPTSLYLNDGPRLLRYDVVAKTFETVLDVSTQTGLFGTNKIIWQVHSSNDDGVHSATLKDGSTYAELGCLAYREDTRQFFYFPTLGLLYDECQIDKSGRWLLIKEKLGIDPVSEVDNRIIDLTTGLETDLLDRNGAGGHSDNGYGYLVASDNWNPLPGAYRLWKSGTTPLGPGTVVYHDASWATPGPQHVSHANTNSGVPPEQQYACGSGASSVNGPRANEVICFPLDASLRVLVVAPVMTDLNAPGGRGGAYGKLPKGNLDVTGQYFIWTSNMGGSRLDAFLVKVPAQLLTGASPDAIPPTISVTAPASGSTLAGIVTVVASASDNVGVAGVQFKLDGLNLGAEVTASPYALSWSTAAAANGSHTLTAVARDPAGNLATSAAVGTTVNNVLDTTPPVISSVTASSTTSSGAAITWTTNVPSDSQVEYGPTSSYGGATPIDTGLVTAHPVMLGNLAASTPYHYRVSSRDAAGNLAVSGDFTFTTLAPDLTTGLVGYWKLDEGSGATATDSSGTGNTGSLVNGPAWTTGKIGGALAFDGVSQSVTIPQAASLNAYPLTVAVWMKTTPTSGLGGLVNKYWPGSLNGWQLFMNAGNLCAWYFKDAADYVWDGTGCTLMSPGHADGLWHHVAFIVDAAGGRLYVDGALKASQPWTGTPGASTTAQPLDLAQYPGTASPYFPGTLDDVRVFNRALSADEVLALYSPAAPNPGLVGGPTRTVGGMSCGCGSAPSADLGALLGCALACAIRGAGARRRSMRRGPVAEAVDEPRVR